MFYFSTFLIQIYFAQLIFDFHDNDDELNDDKYFKIVFTLKYSVI